MKRFVLFVAFLALSSNVLAQFSVRGEVDLTTDATFRGAFPAQVGWTLASHLAAEYDLPPFTLRAVLDPSLRFSHELSFEPGITEVYALTTQGQADISFGIERLPLETARLSVPYRVEPVGKRGLRRGVPGVRLNYYSDDWRFRGAVFYHAGTESLTPLVSVRRTFGSFDIEAHALYMSMNTLVAGVGGSSLISDLVLFGEVWLLTRPLDVRGALGLTGNLDQGMWTLEAAYLSPGDAPIIAGTERDLAVQQAVALGSRPAINGQLALPLGEQGGHNLTFMASALFDPDALRARLASSYTFLSDNRLFTINVGGLVGPELAVLTTSLSVKQFF